MICVRLTTSAGWKWPLCIHALRRFPVPHLHRLPRLPHPLPPPSRHLRHGAHQCGAWVALVRLCKHLRWSPSWCYEWKIWDAITGVELLYYFIKFIYLFLTAASKPWEDNPSELCDSLQEAHGCKYASCRFGWIPSDFRAWSSVNKSTLATHSIFGGLIHKKKKKKSKL